MIRLDDRELGGLNREVAVEADRRIDGDLIGAAFRVGRLRGGDEKENLSADLLVAGQCRRIDCLGSCSEGAQAPDVGVLCLT
jgi:hypothetical protein